MPPLGWPTRGFHWETWLSHAVHRPRAGWIRAAEPAAAHCSMCSSPARGIATHRYPRSRQLRPSYHAALVPPGPELRGRQGRAVRLGLRRDDRRRPRPAPRAALTASPVGVVSGTAQASPPPLGPRPRTRSSAWRTAKLRQARRPGRPRPGRFLPRRCNSRTVGSALSSSGDVPR
jgi:hypothetical protein